MDELENNVRYKTYQMKKIKIVERLITRMKEITVIVPMKIIICLISSFVKS